MAPDPRRAAPRSPLTRSPAARLAAAAGPLAELARILAEERALLLRGDWAGVGALGARKADCLAALEALGAEGWPRTGAEADVIGREVGRNQALLAAAIEGFRDAGQRRAMLRSARGGFQGYDARGARAPGPTPPPARLERKA